MRKYIGILCFMIGVALSGTSAQSSGPIIKMPLKGAIGPAKADFIKKAFKQARLAEAEAIVLEIDTPGGLDTSMREIIQAIVTSPIPVISYVFPSGSRAASAGTYILYASHLAAMAPGTNLGAATPVAVGALPSFIPEQKNPQKEPKPSNKVPTMKEKILNDSVAYIQSLAELRGRNAEWAVESITKAASISAKKAKQIKVIDFLAKDLSHLITQAEGKKIQLQNKKIKIQLSQSKVVEYVPDWRIQFLEVITNPNILYILLLVGFYGLLLEFMNPGFLLPGVIGAICLLLALYSMHVLPVNYAGVGLVVLGIAFMVAEAFMPALGVMGISGLVAFVVGSIFLMDGNAPGYEVSWSVIALMSCLTAGFIALMMVLFLKSRKKKSLNPTEEILGATAYVQSWKNGKGFVWALGESWAATGPKNLQQNTSVVVKKVKGLDLTVEKEK